MTSDHFEGKSVEEHLRRARAKGAIATREAHGSEMAGEWAAFADAAKDTALLLLVAWLLAPAALLLFACGWALWKTGRSARLGWTRLERLHRLIEEERWEIEHHRSQEREELRELYAAKGFSGKLLEDVVDTLMADDHRLLRVMLEEELGVALEAYEHPLKQALGAFLGSASAALLLLTGNLLQSGFGLPLAALMLLILSSVLTAKLEHNRLLQAVVWQIAIAFLTVSTVYFLQKMV